MVPRRQWHRAEWVGASRCWSSSSNVTPWRRHQSTAVGHPRSSESLRHSAEEHGDGRRLSPWPDGDFDPGFSTYQKSLLVGKKAFISLEVCFVPFFSQLARKEQRGYQASRVQWLASFIHAAINCVAMVPSGNIPPAAAAFLYPCRPQEMRICAQSRCTMAFIWLW